MKSEFDLHTTNKHVGAVDIYRTGGNEICDNDISFTARGCDLLGSRNVTSGERISSYDRGSSALGKVLEVGETISYSKTLNCSL